MSSKPSVGGTTELSNNLNKEDGTSGDKLQQSWATSLRRDAEQAATSWTKGPQIVKIDKWRRPSYTRWTGQVKMSIYKLEQRSSKLSLSRGVIIVGQG